MVRREKTANTKMGTLVATRGSVVWGVNKLRSDALTTLLDDLVDLEKAGLKPEQCDIVQLALKKLTNKATELPDGSFWVSSVHSELLKFEETYIRWNSTNEGSAPEKILQRRACLNDLRKIRHKVSKRIRLNQYIIQNELDLKFVNDMYDALGGLVKALPDVFQGLAKSLATIEHRRQ